MTVVVMVHVRHVGVRLRRQALAFTPSAFAKVPGMPRFGMLRAVTGQGCATRAGRGAAAAQATAKMSAASTTAAGMSASGMSATGGNAAASA